MASRGTRRPSRPRGDRRRANGRPSGAPGGAARAPRAGPAPPGSRRARAPARSRSPARRHRAPTSGTGAGIRPGTARLPRLARRPLGQHAAAQIVRGVLQRRRVDRRQVAQRRLTVGGRLLHERQLVTGSRRRRIAREPLHQGPQRIEREPRVARRPRRIRLAEQGSRRHLLGRQRRGIQRRAPGQRGAG